ncbi:MAG TPA: biotin/lipoyl-binding protein, partial [Gemmataceae bacterium]|nr:biotin/lipoyl-binding protein [Gemmataceae bacterium]
MSRCALILSAGLGLLSVLTTGCSQGAGGPPPAPPPDVTVAYPLYRQVTDYHEYTGRTAAVDSVNVQSQVTGYLQKINFKDGAEVKKGAVLYQIDPQPYQAALDQAQAQLK